MSAGLQILLWGVAVCAPVLISVATKKTDAMGLSAMLLLTWCIGRVTGALYSPPESMALYPLIDAACGITAFVAWYTRRAWWKLALTGLFILQCCTHLAFWVAYPTDNATLYSYVALNNLWFALELCCAAGGGVGDVARDLVRRMSDRARARGHARAGP